MLIPDRDALIVDIMEGYEIYVANIIAIEIHDWAISIDTTLFFLCLLT